MINYMMKTQFREKRNIQLSKQGFDNIKEKEKLFKMRKDKISYDQKPQNLTRLKQQEMLKKDIKQNFKRSQKSMKLKLSQEPTLIFTLFHQIKKLRDLMISQQKIRKKLKNQLLQYNLLSQLMIDQHSRLRKSPIQVLQQLANNNIRSLVKEFPKDQLIKQLNQLILKLDQTYFQFKKDSIDDLFYTIKREKEFIRSVQNRKSLKNLSKITATLFNTEPQNIKPLGRNRLSIPVMDTLQPSLGQFEHISNSFIKLEVQLSSFYR